MENIETIEYIKKAFELKEAKNYKPAVEMFYKVLEYENENYEVLFQIGELYFLMNDYDRAIKYLEKVLQVIPTHSMSNNIMRQIEWRKQNYLKSLSYAEIVFENDKTTTNLIPLIEILVKLNKFVDIEKYENSELFTQEVKIKCANAYYNNGKKEKAIKLIEQCNEDSEEVILLKGKIKFDEGDLENSEVILSRIGRDSKNPEILNYLGLFELENMNFINAIKDFSRATSLDKSNAVYYYNLANAYFYNGWLDEAQKAYQKALYLEPDNLDFRYALAYLYYDRKEYAKSKKEVDAILDVFNHSQAVILKALLMAKNNDLLDAKKILENMSKDGLCDNFAKISLAHIYEDLNIYSKAETILKDLIENNCDNLDYYSDLAEIYLKENKFNEAFELSQKIVSKNPRYILGYILLAKTSYLKEDYEMTKSYAQEIISLDMNCSDGYYYLALAWEKFSDLDEAIECLKRAILHDLNNAKYYDKMSEIYKAKKDYKTALEYLSEAVNIDDSEEYKIKYSVLAKENRIVNK